MPGGARRGRRLQQLAALPDARPAAQRPARRGDRRPAGGVHGRHGGQHLGVQHGLHLRPVAALHRARTAPTTTTCGSAGSPRSAATVIAIFTALLAPSYSNIMDYLQTLFGFFNAPLFATFILGMFWKRMTPTAGWIGPGRPAPLAAVLVAFLSEDAFGSAEHSASSRSAARARLRRGVGARSSSTSSLSVVVIAGDRARSRRPSSRAWSTRRRRRRTCTTRTRRATRGTAAPCRSPASRWSWSSSSTSSSEEERT